MEFVAGDYVYLKVSPMRGVHRFGIHGKLAPRYVGLYQVLEKCGPVAYRLQLLDILSAVHNVFHVSQLKKCLWVPDEAVQMEGLPLQLDLTYVEHPIKILDEERVTRNRVVKFYKVQWQNHSEAEATWEQESYHCSITPTFSLALIVSCYAKMYSLPLSHTKHMKSRVEILF